MLIKKALQSINYLEMKHNKKDKKGNGLYSKIEIHLATFESNETFKMSGTT